jgi:hypothetical protein
MRAAALPQLVLPGELTPYFAYELPWFRFRLAGYFRESTKPFDALRFQQGNKHARKNFLELTEMLYAVLGLSIGCASALQYGSLPRRFAAPRAPRTVMVESWYDSGARLESEDAAEEMLPYFCNENGCWIGEAPPVTLPDGRKISAAGNSVQLRKGEVVPSKRKPAQTGLFAPLVVGTKAVMGEKELNKLRADVISQHSKVISAFVDTSDSPFGQIVLKRMFEAADKDGNGTLDRDEVREALHALGFQFVEDKQLDKIFERGDADGNEVIDFEEFVNETPKTLRSSLIKMAKLNGHDLGFLA